MKTQSLTGFVSIFLLVILVDHPLLSQISSFGSQARHKIKPIYQMQTYLYYDLIRSMGAGFKYQVLEQFSLDAALYSVRPNPALDNVQWDYSKFKGFGLSLAGRYHFGLTKRVYVGNYLSVESLHHGVETVNYKYQDYEDIYTYTYDCRGTAVSLGVTMGANLAEGQLSMEPFFSLGIQNLVNYQMNMYSQPAFAPTTVNLTSYIDGKVGIKIGFGIRGSKAHEGLDEKFDKEYIPRYDAMVGYIDTINVRHIRGRQQRSVAKRTIRELEDVNEELLKIYYDNYLHSARMIRKMDEQFSLLEERVKALKALLESTY